MQYLKNPHKTVALVHISPTSPHAAPSEAGLEQSLDTNCIDPPTAIREAN